MKYIISSAVGLVLFNTICFAQPCVIVRIQTAAVAKPNQADVTVANNCSEGKISWKGNAGQTYIVSITDEKGQVLQEARSICDNDLNCYAVLPVKPGQKINYTIQAIALVDNRTFYSYPLYGEIPGCDEGIVAIKNGIAASADKTPHIPVKTDLMVYPNPVTGELTIKWSGDYEGNARLMITDASGKTVRQTELRKQLPDYLDRIPVNTLSPGLYFMHIQMQNGKMISTRFVKN
jgi:hypothetical protein